GNRLLQSLKVLDAEAVPEHLQGFRTEPRSLGQFDEMRWILLPEGFELGDLPGRCQFEDLVRGCAPHTFDRGQFRFGQTGQIARITLDSGNGVLVGPDLERLGRTLLESGETGQFGEHAGDLGTTDHATRLSPWAPWVPGSV